MRNYVGSPEYDILPEVAPIPGESLVTKTSNGAFASSTIDSVLRALGAQQLYLNGESSNMCGDTRARGRRRGHMVTIVEDACGGTRSDLHGFAMRNFARLFGRVTWTEHIVAKLGLMIWTVR